MENKYWVAEHGCDCDGAWTRGRIIGFVTKDEAEQCLESSYEWSDGMTYELIESEERMKEYCNDYNLNPENYIQ